MMKDLVYDDKLRQIAIIRGHDWRRKKGLPGIKTRTIRSLMRELIDEEHERLSASRAGGRSPEAMPMSEIEAYRLADIRARGARGETDEWRASFPNRGSRP